MLTSHDYNIFIRKWQEYLSFSGITEELKNQLMTKLAIRNAKCTVDEFVFTLSALMQSSISGRTIDDVLSLAHYQWLPKEDVESKALGLWRLLTLNAKSGIDLVFSDDRACLAFYLVFGNLKRFLKSDLDNNDHDLSREFIDSYLSCNVNDFNEVIRANRIQLAQSRKKPFNHQEVCFIGDYEKAKVIADEFYGNNAYIVYRSDVTGALKELNNVHLERERESSRIQLALNMTEDQKKSQMALIDNVLNELKVVCHD